MVAGTPTTSHVDRAVLLVILAVAALLRVEYLTQIEHNVDHAYPIWQALQTLERGVWPLVGQGTSVLFANPALMGYLYLPLVGLARSPLAAYVLIIPLNTLAVLLAYRAVRALLGVRGALVAAGLMAVNPWVIEYSRMAWVQSLLPFFTCAIAWLLWPILLGRSKRPGRRLLLALALLTLFTQTYLLSFLMIAPVGLLVLLFWRQVPKRELALGSAALVVATGIYGIGLVSQWETTQAQIGAFAASPARLTDEAWGHAVRLVSGGDYAVARGTQAPQGDAALRQELSQAAHGFILMALVVGIGLTLVAVARGRQRAEASIVLVWFGVPVLLMSYTGQPVHPFYQLLGLPAGYALAAWGLSALFRPQTRLGSVVLLGLALPFSVLMGLNSARYYQETAAIPGAHGLTALPLDYGIQLGQAIVEHLPEGGVVYAEVEGWVLNSLAGKTFPVVQDARAPAFNFIPRQGGVYVAAHPPGADTTLGPLRAERAVTMQLPDGWTLTVDTFAPISAETFRGAQMMDIPSEQGIRLCCYELTHHGNEWTLTTYWRVDFLAEGVEAWLFAPFAHVFDATGERVLILDGAVVPGERWHEGDYHAHRMRFSLPTDRRGPFRLMMGQYDSVRQENAIFRPPDGSYIPLVALPDELER